MLIAVGTGDTSPAGSAAPAGGAARTLTGTAFPTIYGPVQVRSIGEELGLQVTVRGDMGAPT